MTQTNANLQERLIQAIYQSNQDEIDNLIKAGANPNGKTSSGEYIIHNVIASYHRTKSSKQLNIIKLLLESGADSNVFNRSGETPLSYAAYYGLDELATLLVSHAVDVNFPNARGETPFNVATDPKRIPATKSGREKVAVILLDAGSNPNTPASDGETPLIRAINADDLVLVAELLKHGADPNMPTSAGVYPILNAVQYTNTEAASLLIAAGADINRPYSQAGVYVLMISVFKGDLPTVNLLLTSGANVLARNKMGLSAIDYAKDGTMRTLILSHMPRWKGFDSADLDNKHLSIFERKESDGGAARCEAENQSFCPVCLNWVVRSTGCMYMSHNCLRESTAAGSTQFVHMPLFLKYNQNGNIEWCTICGRICGDIEPSQHRHYPLMSIMDPKPSLIKSTAHPFGREADCIAFGGGGYDEKLARIRLFRKKALELESEIDKISDHEAYTQLVEVCWDPRSDDASARAANMAAQKFLESNASLFSKKTADAPAGNAPNIPTPFSQKIRPVEGLYGEEHTNAMLNEPSEGNELLDIPYENGYTERVTRNTLRDMIRYRIKDFGVPEMRFGFCLLDPSCSHKLYPDLLKDFVDEADYLRYKQLFNEKFRVQKAGGRRRQQTRRNRRRRIQTRKR